MSHKLPEEYHQKIIEYWNKAISISTNEKPIHNYRELVIGKDLNDLYCILYVAKVFDACKHEWSTHFLAIVENYIELIKNIQKIKAD